MKSLSGPSGRTVGPKFVFDETRSRFVYPQDKSLILYFEWQAPLGDHTLVAIWKGPDGRVLSISPDVKIDNKASILPAYWQYLIAPGSPSGVWTCEVRIDGEPAGSQSFELVMPALQAVPTGPAPPKHPTEDEIYTKVARSLVWVYALDRDGTRLDSSQGFVYKNGVIATSFEAIDSAAGLEVEFSNGQRLRTNDVLACSRLRDWALLKLDTGTVSAVEFGQAGNVKVGERLFTFNATSQHVRQFGGVDVTARPEVNDSGLPIQFAPDLGTDATGGPLLDLDGRVIAILGASLTPGARLHHKDVSNTPGLFNSFNSLSGAVPISALPEALPSAPETLDELLTKKVFTRPLSFSPSFLWGTTSSGAVAKKASEVGRRSISEFRRNQSVTVEMMWQKREKNGKGLLSAEVFDISNQVRIRVPPKKFSLDEQSTSTLAFSFPALTLEPGTYRVDVLWNDSAVWRVFFTIVE